MSGRAAHALRWIIAVAPATGSLSPLACGDRAPPALWPEPPPPTLAAPIGIDEAAGEGAMRTAEETAPPQDTKPRSKLPPSQPPATEPAAQPVPAAAKPEAPQPKLTAKPGAAP